MKKIFVVFAVFAALIFVVSCGGGSKTVNQNDEPDIGETVTDEDSADSKPDDSEPSDTTPDNPDNPDTTPEQPDNEETANENPDNLPECSPTSATPCIDSEGINADWEKTNLIWSGKSPERLNWIDAIDYCKNLKEGGYSDWRLPPLAALKTLIRKCESDGYSDGECSKFGDIVFLWSSTGGSSEASGVVFYDGETQSKNVDKTFDLRCVRRGGSETRQANCKGLIENSVWNTATQITQTWDWETAGWTPSLKGSYNAEETSSECRFKCDSSSFWNGSSKCLNPCKPNSPCTGIGETGICISKSAMEYACECEDNYFWLSDSNKCVKNTCQENSCDIPNSTGICNPVRENQYSCDCQNGYYWWGSKNQCLDKKPLTLGNICTGQNKCYNVAREIACPTSESDDYFGQDAYYANLGKCTPQNLTVQTLSSQDVVVDQNTDLMWQQTIPTEKYTWEDAFSYCDGLTYAGYSDWRLPTPQELLTIVASSWSSATFVNTTHSAWYVYLEGYVSFDSATANYSVRCVRGRTTLSESSFKSSTVNGDVIVTDTETGLVWQKSYVSGKTWREALAYCESLTYAGYSDWRLPNKNELVSLVNYKKYNPASDFPDMPFGTSEFFWSSSTDASLTDSAWGVNFIHGNVGSGYKTCMDGTIGVVRCVR